MTPIGEIIDFEPHRPEGGLSLWKSLLELAAHHHFHDLVEARLRHRTLADEMSIAQHRDPVADLENLLHTVRDVDDADAARFQVRHDLEQRADLAVGERGGGLVHDQHTGVERQRLCDLDQLLESDRERLRRPIHVDLPGADLAQPACRLAVHTAALDHAEAVRLAPQEQVIHHRELRNHVELLVNDGDAERLRFAGRADRDRLRRR